MSYAGIRVLDATFTLRSNQIALTGHQGIVLDVLPVSSDDMTVLNPTPATPADTFPIGIAQVDEAGSVQPGKQVTVRVAGISKAIASKAIAAGKRVSVTAQGHMTDAAPTSINQWYVGIALTAASQLFDDMLVLLNQELREV